MTASASRRARPALSSVGRAPDDSGRQPGCGPHRSADVPPATDHGVLHHVAQLAATLQRLDPESAAAILAQLAASATPRWPPQQAAVGAAPSRVHRADARPPVLALPTSVRAVVAELASEPAEYLEQFDPECALTIAQHLLAASLARVPQDRLRSSAAAVVRSIRVAAQELAMGETAGTA